MGEPADLTNAVWYLFKEDYTNAGLSGISIIPFIGDYAGKSLKYVERVGSTVKAIERSGEKLKVFKSVGKKIADAPGTIVDVEKTYGNLGHLINVSTDVDNLNYYYVCIKPKQKVFAGYNGAYPPKKRLSQGQPDTKLKQLSFST